MSKLYCTPTNPIPFKVWLEENMYGDWCLDEFTECDPVDIKRLFIGIVNNDKVDIEQAVKYLHPMLKTISEKHYNDYKDSL